MKYCVYQTIYEGDKLPRNYIGSSSIERVNQGYRGSVCSKKYKEVWKSELQDNPHLFNTHVLETFDTREQALARELELQKQYDAIRS